MSSPTGQDRNTFTRPSQDSTRALVESGDPHRHHHHHNHHSSSNYGLSTPSDHEGSSSSGPGACHIRSTNNYEEALAGSIGSLDDMNNTNESQSDSLDGQRHDSVGNDISQHHDQIKQTTNVQTNLPYHIETKVASNMASTTGSNLTSPTGSEKMSGSGLLSASGGQQSFDRSLQKRDAMERMLSDNGHSQGLVGGYSTSTPNTPI